MLNIIDWIAPKRVAPGRYDVVDFQPGHDEEILAEFVTYERAEEIIAAIRARRAEEK